MQKARLGQGRLPSLLGLSNGLPADVKARPLTLAARSQALTLAKRTTALTLPNRPSE